MGEVHWSSRKTQPWELATRHAARFATTAAVSRPGGTHLVSGRFCTTRAARSAAATRRRANPTYICDACVRGADDSTAAVAKYC